MRVAWRCRNSFKLVSLALLRDISASRLYITSGHDGRKAFTVVHSSPSPSPSLIPFLPPSSVRVT